MLEKYPVFPGISGVSLDFPFSRDFLCLPRIFHAIPAGFCSGGHIMTTSYALLFHHHNSWWLNFASVICDYFCAHRRCCFSAIQIFPQSLISKLQKDSPKDKARPKCGPSSGTLGPIQMIFTRGHLPYWAGSVFKYQLYSTKTLWVVAFPKTFFASIL